jgi:hypothetical protein
MTQFSVPAVGITSLCFYVNSGILTATRLHGRPQYFTALFFNIHSTLTLAVVIQWRRPSRPCLPWRGWDFLDPSSRPVRILLNPLDTDPSDQTSFFNHLNPGSRLISTRQTRSVVGPPSFFCSIACVFDKLLGQGTRVSV